MALKYVSESMCKYVERPFGEKEFKIFLQKIDPQNISDRELCGNLGLDYFEDFMEIWAPDWYVEKNKNGLHHNHFALEKRYRDEIGRRLFSTRRSSIKKIFDDRARDMERLKWKSLYAILSSRHYRERKYSGLPDSEDPPIRFISTPMGGMPGYKIKRRRL